jgi:hypothetical protein
MHKQPNCQKNHRTAHAAIQGKLSLTLNTRSFGNKILIFTLVETKQSKQSNPFPNLGEPTRTPLRRMRLFSGPATNVDHLIEDYSDVFDQMTLAGPAHAFKATSDVDDVFSIDLKKTRDFEPGLYDVRSEMTSASSVYFEPDSDYKYHEGYMPIGMQTQQFCDVDDKPFDPAVPTYKRKEKTEICKNWLQGVCRYGAQCAFAHGREEV